MPVIDRKVVQLIDDFVSKYMKILECDEPPSVVFANNLGSPWLGKCHWWAEHPRTSRITLQKRILNHLPSLERVIAHEMVHHWEFTNLTPTQIAGIRMGIRPRSHGERFEKGAEIINQIMGGGFVTKTSDESYELESNTKKFYVLIMPTVRGERLGWAWAARLTPQIKDRIKQKKTDGARLVTTTDERWTIGTKIKRFGGFSLPLVGSQIEKDLIALYESDQVMI